MYARLLSFALFSLLATETLACADLFQTPLRKLHSKDNLDLCTLTDGKPVLVVNTASHCGFTRQFEGLEALYKSYGPRGLVVLGVPSDDFFQEEDDEKATADICYINYGVTFPMAATAPVRGSDAIGLFKTLAERSGTTPKWNFYKYLVRADGSVAGSWGSRTEPDAAELRQAIEALLPAASATP